MLFNMAYDANVGYIAFIRGFLALGGCATAESTEYQRESADAG